MFKRMRVILKVFILNFSNRIYTKMVQLSDAEDRDGVPLCVQNRYLT